MGIHTTDVIVLRRWPFRETSVTVSCLSARFGKFKGLVKGLRKLPNRYRSAMEPLTINRVVFYDTRTSQLHLISQCELLAPLSALQRDLPTMQAAAFCVELADVVVPLEAPQPGLYELLKDTLERLALGAGDVLAIRLHFIVRLLRIIGFEPQVDECTGCMRQARMPAFWSTRQGGLVCERCRHLDPQAEVITEPMLNAIEAFAQADAPLALEQPLLLMIQSRLNEFLDWRVDRPLKTMRV